MIIGARSPRDMVICCPVSVIVALVETPRSPFCAVASSPTIERRIDFVNDPCPEVIAAIVAIVNRKVGVSVPCCVVA